MPVTPIQRDQIRAELADMPAKLAQLRSKSVAELRQLYEELTGRATPARNGVWLRRRCAWLLQAEAEGGLSDETKTKLEEIGSILDAEARRKAKVAPAPPSDTATATARPPRAPARPPKPRDPRLPPVGTVLRREYAGEVHEARVLDQGVEYRGMRFRTLSGVASHLAGHRCNGFVFFGLAPAHPRPPDGRDA